MSFPPDCSIMSITRQTNTPWPKLNVLYILPCPILPCASHPSIWQCRGPHKRSSVCNSDHLDLQDFVWRIRYYVLLPSGSGWDDRLLFQANLSWPSTCHLSTSKDEPKKNKTTQLRNKRIDRPIAAEFVTVACEERLCSICGIFWVRDSTM